MTKIKGVILDMDGVITNTDEYSYMAWKLLSSSIGIHMGKELYKKLEGTSKMEVLNVILEHGHREKDFTEAEKLTLVAKRDGRYADMLNQFTKRNLLPGVEDLLKELKGLGIKIGVASTIKTTKTLLQLLKVDDYIDFVLDPVSIPVSLNSHVYIRACEGLGLKTKNCMGFVSDINGLEAVKKASMLALAIGDEDILSNADFIYSSPNDIQLKEII